MSFWTKFSSLFHCFVVNTGRFSEPLLSSDNECITSVSVPTHRATLLTYRPPAGYIRFLVSWCVYICYTLMYAAFVGKICWNSRGNDSFRIFIIYYIPSPPLSLSCLYILPLFSPAFISYNFQLHTTVTNISTMFSNHAIYVLLVRGLILHLYKTTQTCRSILKGSDDGVLHLEELCYWNLSIV
jgi:hypothetical protein